MSKKIKTHNIGDCVEVSTWIHDGSDGFFVPAKEIGLVIEAELVEMDAEVTDRHYLSVDQQTKEWLYRVSLPDGRVCEVWDYEVKHVNSNIAKYNNVSPQTRGTNGRTQEKRS